MQENNPIKGAGQQGGASGNAQNQKPSGLSWSQAPQGSQVGTKSATPVTTPLVPSSMQKPLPTVPAMKSSTPMPSMNTKSTQQNTSSNRVQWVVTFITGLVVGGLLGWVWFALRPAPSANMATTATSTSATTGNTSGAAMTATNNNPTSVASGITLPATGTVTGTTAPVSSGNSNLTIASPQASGLQVGISNVVVSQPTWVVIYDSTAGQPGRVLGAQMFFPGVTSGTVNLLRGTLPGQMYFAGESLDDGDHKFSTTNDKPVRNADASLMLVQFQTN